MASFDKNAKLKEAENDKNAELDKVHFDKNAEIEPGGFCTCWILSAEGKAMSTGSFRYRGIASSFDRVSCARPGFGRSGVFKIR